MKYHLLFITLFSFFNAVGQEDYTLQLNDTSIKVSLDKKYEIIVNGKKIVFSLKANDTLSYDNELVSFHYLKGFNTSKTVLDAGIEQTVIMSAEGSGLIIQKYSSLNPTMLNEILLREVTKESVNYGFVLKREDYEKIFPNGQKIKIDRAVLKYKDETNIYEVTSIGKKDEGIVIMTMRMDSDKNSQGQKLIDLMWKTLRIK